MVTTAWVTGRDGIRRLRLFTDPTTQAVTRILAGIQAETCPRRDQPASTVDHFLADADASITGWRERQDEALHYHFKDTA